MRDRFETIVDVEGWHHHEEAVGVDRADKRGDYEGVPRFMGFILERVASVGEKEGDSNHVEIFEGYGIVFFGLLFRLGENLFVFEGDAVGDQGVRGCGADADVDDSRDFPQLDEDAHSLGEENHPAGVLIVVQQVEEDDTLHEDISENRADRNSNIVLLVSIVADV